MSNSFKIDFWTLWGLVAQGLFFGRFVIQWYLSERAKKTVIPNIFWYLSLMGAIMTLIYAVVRTDMVFLLTGVLQIILYSRNLMLVKKTKI
jgi:lipid-A-disaccharide synthase-like uncharacterized protein